MGDMQDIGVSLDVRRQRGGNRWAYLRLPVEPAHSHARHWHCDAFISQLGANCFYFNFEMCRNDQTASAMHTIKFDGAKLRTYGCGGADSSTATNVQSGRPFSIDVHFEFARGAGENTIVRHSIDGREYFVSRLSREFQGVRQLELGAAAYS